MAGEPVHVGGSVATPGAYGGMGGGSVATSSAYGGMGTGMPMGTVMMASAMPTMATMAAPTMAAMPTMAAPMTMQMGAPTMTAMPAMTTMAAPAMAAPTMATYGNGTGSIAGAPMVAQTASYAAAAPAMTTMAAPTMSAMPAMTMAAPTVNAMPTINAAMPAYGGSFVAAPPMQMPSYGYGGGSFVAAQPMPAYGPAMPPPPVGPPQRLTAGIPDPMSIEQQKLAYSRAIDVELQKEAQQVQARAQAEKQMLTKRTQGQKAQTYLTIDQYAQYGNMYVDDMTLSEVAYLQEESAQHRLVLEQQASALALEYNQRKAQEDMTMRQYQIQKQYYDNSRRLQGMQSEVRRGVIPQGILGGSVAQAGTPAPGTVLYDSAKQGAGMVPGVSMVTGATQQAVGGGQTPLATVAANRTSDMLGPGRASSLVTQGTATGVGATQGVTSASMGATNALTQPAYKAGQSMGQSMMGRK